MFLWLVWGLFMVDLGFVYMMFLKDYLQYEKQKRRENQRIRKAGKQRSWKSRKAKKQRSKEETEIKKTSAQNGELCHLRVPAVADVAPGLRSGCRQLHHLETMGKLGKVKGG